MKQIDPYLVLRTEEKLNERYSSRLKEFGDDPRTLGWDTVKNQQTRFQIATQSMDFTQASILDVGCGLGDFHHHLKQNNIQILSYSGLDINPDLIQRCQQRDTASHYQVGNLLNHSFTKNSVDIVCLFGLLNFRFKEFNNIDFAQAMIQQAFNISRKAVIVDMLSDHNDEHYAREDFVYYYKPNQMLDYALTLTPHVQMRHDYPSIPQREFMLIMNNAS